MQGPLPGLPPGEPKWKQELHWSVSRQRTWEHCRRAFFYDAIAPKLLRPPVPLEQLLALRRLSPWFVVKGAAVHTALEEGIRASRRGVDPIHVARLVLDHELRRLKRAPAETLAEVANGGAFDADALEHLRGEGRAMVERFFPEVWPRYAARRYLHHEEPRGLEVAGHRVRLKLDLLTAGPEGLLITDWKTGREQDVEDDLQLGTYILWATRAFREVPERVEAEFVYLPHGVTKPTRRTAAQLAHVERFIARNLEAMKRLDGLAEATPNPGKHCLECRFATICAEGKGALR